MPHSHAKINLKSGTQKLEFVMVRAISKSYILDCSCEFFCAFPHGNAASFSIKTILCENTKILFSNNYWKLGEMKPKFWKKI